MNVVVVQGILSRVPEERELASGSRVVSYSVRTNRSAEPAEAVPVVWVDPPAAGLAIEVGSEVVAVGRVRSRFYRSGGAVQTRTEVVADVVLVADQKRRVRTAIRRAAQTLEEAARTSGRAGS